MEFKKLLSPSLKDMFIREIERLILSGELSVGDKLPSERELSQNMGVSRTVINSGLLDLEKKGFIEIRPRIGAFVDDYKRKGTVETLLSFIHFNGTMKKGQVKSLLEFRLVIETLALELMITNLTDEDINVLRGLTQSVLESKTPQEQAESIFQLHHEICILSGNFLLPVVFYSFKEMAIWLWIKYFTIHGPDQLFESTRELFDYIKKRDNDGAVKTFQASLNKTIDGIVSIYNE